MPKLTHAASESYRPLISMRSAWTHLSTKRMTKATSIRVTTTPTRIPRTGVNCSGTGLSAKNVLKFWHKGHHTLSIVPISCPDATYDHRWQFFLHRKASSRSAIKAPFLSLHLTQKGEMLLGMNLSLVVLQVTPYPVHPYQTLLPDKALSATI